MIKDLILKEVPRDLKGIEEYSAKTENIIGTISPSHLYGSKNSNIKLKNNVLMASIFASTISSTNPNFSNINFCHTEKSNDIASYYHLIENPFQLTLEEYKSIFKYSFTLNDFINEILSFKSLNNNWDGYGAIPTEIRCASQAIQLANRLSEKLLDKISEIFPTPNGTVTIEWENYSGERLVAEIGSETFSYYLKLNSFNPRFFNDVSISNESISELSSNIKKLFL